MRNSHLPILPRYSLFQLKTMTNIWKNVWQVLSWWKKISRVILDEVHLYFTSPYRHKLASILDLRFHLKIRPPPVTAFSGSLPPNLELELLGIFPKMKPLRTSSRIENISYRVVMTSGFEAMKLELKKWTGNLREKTIVFVMGETWHRRCCLSLQPWWNFDLYER